MPLDLLLVGDAANVVGIKPKDIIEAIQERRVEYYHAGNNWGWRVSLREVQQAFGKSRRHTKQNAR